MDRRSFIKKNSAASALAGLGETNAFASEFFHLEKTAIKISLPWKMQILFLGESPFQSNNPIAEVQEQVPFGEEKQKINGMGKRMLLYVPSVADFFGTSPGWNEYKTLPMGMTADWM